MWDKIQLYIVDIVVMCSYSEKSTRGRFGLGVSEFWPRLASLDLSGLIKGVLS